MAFAVFLNGLGYDIQILLLVNGPGEPQEVAARGFQRGYPRRVAETGGAGVSAGVSAEAGRPRR
jgi:hypothetical protein